MTEGGAPAARPEHPQSDGEVRLAVYRGFLEDGRAPSVRELAAELKASPAEIDAALRRLAERHVLVLEKNSAAPRIRMAMPFSAVKTDFRVEIPFGGWWANCAWDALGIPALLKGAGRLPKGAPTRITTHCPDCGDRLELRLQDDGRPQLATDEPAPPPVVHFALPAARWWDDILYT
jgi:DNA-binding transcriptional MocR family regulator